MELHSKKDLGLKIIQSLNTNLSKKNIEYCHWKSNEHVDAAVKGETDLDILFSFDQKDSAKKVLKDSGFKLFIAPWWRQYPNIEDYIGIDSETGKIVHVHAHFRLVLGESGVKSYHLPWEDEIIKTRIFYKNCQIYISSPCMELLLLICRLGIKLESRRLNSKNKKEIEDYIIESSWLKDRVTKKELSNLFINKFGELNVEIIDIIYDSKFDLNAFLIVNKLVKNEFKKYRRFSKNKAFFIKIIRGLYSKFASFKVKLGLWQYKPKRNLPDNGIIISLMGADGSGKSTQTDRLISEFKQKVDVYYVYMGSGKGCVSLNRKIIIKLRKVTKAMLGYKNNIDSSSINNTTEEPKQLSVIKVIGKIIMALSIAREKRARLLKAYKMKKRGGIIICDRYPQKVVFGYNDGPRLNYFLNSKNPILKKLAAYEYSLYKITDEIYPDLVFKLLADPLILKERRPEMNLDRIIQKQEGVKTIRFQKKSEIIEVNANLEVDLVTAKIMNSIGIKLNYDDNNLPK